jgi:hypothetical protein
MHACSSVPCSVGMPACWLSGFDRAICVSLDLHGLEQQIPQTTQLLKAQRAALTMHA